MKRTHYIINSDTLAIIPLDKTNSLIYEENQILIVNRKPTYIIDYNCKNNGSSMRGRLDFTEYLTGVTYKAPIMMDEKENIIFFPTTSPRLNKCSWINLDKVKKIYFDDEINKTIILFSNKKSLKFDISLNIMNNQIYKASRLENLFIKNKLKNS